MKIYISVILIAVAAFFLLRPRKTAAGEKQKSIFSTLTNGVYSGSNLTATDSSTAPTTATTTAPTTTVVSSSGRRTTGFSLNNYPNRTPFLN